MWPSKTSSLHARKRNYYHYYYYYLLEACLVEGIKSSNELDRTVDIMNMAVDTIPQDRPDRASRLNNLGAWLSKRFERSSSSKDLDHAINVTSMAADAARDHYDRAEYLDTLGGMLGKRFEQNESINDLDCAIKATNIAVNVTSQEHPS